MTDFWSRRKAAVEAEARTEEAAVRAEETQAHEEALAEVPDEELLAELDLPDPEDIETTDQVQAFLKSNLPQRLKTRALRKLWRLNPILANVDGLVDYGEDYTDAATVIENMQTVYQVGKGMFDKVAEAAKEAEAKEAAALAKLEQQAREDAEETEEIAAAHSRTSDASAEDQSRADTAPPAQADALNAVRASDHAAPHRASDHAAPHRASDHAATPPAPENTAFAAPATRRMRFRFDTAT